MRDQAPDRTKDQLWAIHRELSSANLQGGVFAALDATDLEDHDRSVLETCRDRFSRLGRTCLQGIAGVMDSVCGGEAAQSNLSTVLTKGDFRVAWREDDGLEVSAGTPDREWRMRVGPHAGIDLIKMSWVTPAGVANTIYASNSHDRAIFVETEGGSSSLESRSEVRLFPNGVVVQRRVQPHGPDGVAPRMPGAR